MRILLDTNVVLDVALARQPFYQAAAIDSQVEIIVTRNKADYRSSLLTVLTPDEFGAAHLA